MATHNVKHGEARCHGEKCASVKGSDAIRNRSHGVLADAVVDVATRVITINTTLGPQLGLFLSVSCYSQGKSTLTC